MNLEEGIEERGAGCWRRRWLSSCHWPYEPSLRFALSVLTTSASLQPARFLQTNPKDRHRAVDYQPDRHEEHEGSCRTIMERDSNEAAQPWSKSLDLVQTESRPCVNVQQHQATTDHKSRRCHHPADGNDPGPGGCLVGGRRSGRPVVLFDLHQALHSRLAEPPTRRRSARSSRFCRPTRGPRNPWSSSPLGRRACRQPG